MTGDDLAGLRLAQGDALFLDFDGTLAEIGPDPDVIALPPGVPATLARLSVRLGQAVAILSGRDLRDLASRTPATVWRAGGHGLEILPPGASPPPAPEPPPDPVLAPLRAAALAPGVRLEIKGAVAALHFRAAPEAEADCLAAAVAAAAAAPALVHQPGKMVVEVKPAAADKGAALRRLAAAAPFAGRRPIMLGDDATDEDAFAAVQALGGIGVKVGPGPTAARIRAADPAAIRAWLDRESLAQPQGFHTG
jgi:trehalose 6-phosphate phosphatase